MTAMTVVCKGSGGSPRSFTTNKKAICGHCQKSVEVSPSSGRLRNHKVRLSGRQLRGGR